MCVKMLFGWIGSSDSIRERAEGENFQPFHFMHLNIHISHCDGLALQESGTHKSLGFFCVCKKENVRFPCEIHLPVLG